MVVLPTHTYRAAPFLAAASRLGLEIVVASNEASSLAAFMPGRQLTLDLGRPDQSAEVAAEFARDRPVTAVVGVDETAVTTAAHVASRLGLRHSPVAGVEATRDKRRLRRLLAAGGVAQPAFVEIPDGGAAAHLERAGRTVGYPCVVKPTGMAGSRGVIRADDEAGLLAAARRARRICGDDTAALLVEAFVGGPEVAVEALLTAGRLDVITVFDKPDPLEGPYFEETLYVRPSRHSAGAQQDIGRITQRAVQALGLTDGPIHAELRLSTEGPVVIEVAARSIGGLCSRVLGFAGGATLEEVILRQAIGMPIDTLILADGATGVLMLPIPQRGTLRRVTGMAAARSVTGIEDVAITIPAGEQLVPLPEGDRYLGFVFAQAPTPEAVEQALRTAQAHLTVDIIIEGTDTKTAR